MARLLLVLIISGSEFHKTGAARAKARSPSVEQLTFGTNRRDCADERRAFFMLGLYPDKCSGLFQGFRNFGGWP